MKKVSKIDLIKTLEQELNYKRFVHTLSVAGTAASLAMCYGADLEKAEMAGLLHDCAKCIDVRKMQRLCEKAGLEVSSYERNSSSLLHSKAGSVLAAEKYGCTDPDILNAIRYHTTGRPGMSLLEKVIFVADFTSEERDYYGAEIMRQKSRESLEEAMIFGFQFTLCDLTKRKLAIHPDEVFCYNDIILNEGK